jgi:hypothetical protein
MTDSVRLQFRYADLEREITVFRALAAKFFAPGGDEVLLAVQRNLTATKTIPAEQDWALDGNWPLRTVPSREYHRAGGEHGEPLVAQIEFLWSITPSGPGLFAVTDKASTRIRVLREDNTEIAMWRIELGALDAPGCYFHAQILGEASHAPFPDSLPIPRLPVFCATPIAAVEFILGELFQGSWSERVASGGDNANIYGQVQRNRWRAWLTWQTQILEARSGSPWLAIKHEAPADDLFTAKNPRLRPVA